MRQIESESTLMARRKRRQFVLSALMILILVGSTLGYAISLISSDSSTPASAPNEPFFDGVSWIVPYGSVQIRLQTSPTEAAAVPLSGSIDRAPYQGSVVYIAGERESITQELGGVLGLVAQRVQEACYGPCNRTDLPEKGCNDLLVVWKPSETQRLSTNASCVFIEGDYRAADAFVYRLLGHL